MVAVKDRSLRLQTSIEYPPGLEARSSNHRSNVGRFVIRARGLTQVAMRRNAAWPPPLADSLKLDRDNDYIAFESTRCNGHTRRSHGDGHRKSNKQTERFS
jgi:hypothetical protein